MEIPPKLKKDFTKAKIALLSPNANRNVIFITTVLFALDCMWDESIPTACTNGKSIKFNPTFFDSLTHPQQVTLIAHETWHVALNHMSRMQGLDPETANHAADYVINIMLKDAGYEPLPDWLCLDKYRKWSTKQVYDDLMKNKKDGKPEPQNGQGGDIDTIDPKAPTAGEQAQDIKEIIVRANTAKKQAEQSTGKSAGAMPGELEVMIEGYLNPKLPWQTILQNYMSEMDKSDYSFQRPNRRYMPDVFIPSLSGEGMGDIALVYDISCSVTNHELRQYTSEADDVIRKLEPSKVDIVTFDTQIQDTYTLDQGETAEHLVFHGRGGTSLRCVFEYFKDKRPSVIVIFSDLECTPTPIENKPNVDVIWICVNNPRAKVNFGKLIHVDLGNSYE